VEKTSSEEGDEISVEQSSNQNSEEESSDQEGEDSELTDHEAIRANLNATGAITISVESETDEISDATQQENFYVPNIHRKNLEISTASEIISQY